MSVTGEYPVAVKPEEWLIGPPPSDRSAVTMPTDHWIELGLATKIALRIEKYHRSGGHFYKKEAISVISIMVYLK